MVTLTEDLRELEHVALDGAVPFLCFEGKADLPTLDDGRELEEVACHDDLVLCEALRRERRPVFTHLDAPEWHCNLPAHLTADSTEFVEELGLYHRNCMQAIVRKLMTMQRH